MKDEYTPSDVCNDRITEFDSELFDREIMMEDAEIAFLLDLDAEDLSDFDGSDSCEDFDEISLWDMSTDYDVFEDFIPKIEGFVKQTEEGDFDIEHIIEECDEIILDGDDETGFLF